MVRLNESQPPMQNPPVPPKTSALSVKTRRRNLYFIIGLIAIVAIVSAFAFAYLTPQGQAASVSVGMNYTVGEKMTYEYIMSESMMGHSMTQNGNMTMEVLSFDGENYTLRETVNIQLQQFSYTVKINKTGYIVDYGGLPTQFQQNYGSPSGMPGFGLYFQKNEMKVGESFQIPFQMQTDQLSFAGLFLYRISEVKNITVPAGTYDAFRLETTGFIFGSFGSSSLTGISPGVTATLKGSMNGYGYMEVGTCRQIEYHMNMQVSVSAMSTSLSMSMTMSLVLTEDIRP